MFVKHTFFNAKMSYIAHVSCVVKVYFYGLGGQNLPLFLLRFLPSEKAKRVYNQKSTLHKRSLFEKNQMNYSDSRFAK